MLMKIDNSKPILGDLLEYFLKEKLETGKTYLILHLCNNHGYMGAGFAKQLKESFPNVFVHYRNFVQRETVLENLLGKTLFVTTQRPNLYVGNMIGMNGVYHAKGNPQPIRYEKLDECLRAARVYADSLGNCEVHMPEIGTGKAKGYKPRIEQSVDAAFGDYKTPIHIWRKDFET